MKNILTLILSVLVLTSCIFGAKAGAINSHKVDGEENVAIKGYDTVAYFTEKKPTIGSQKFSHSWNGTNWYFSSEENKNKFMNNPEGFAPQYGGFCAYGVSVPESKIDIDPKAWHIHEGKLYLNYTIPTQEIWLEDKLEHIQAANKVWPRIKAE